MYYRRVRQGHFEDPVVITATGCDPGFATVNSDGKLVVVRAEYVWTYNREKETRRYKIESAPRMIAYMGTSYLIACFNSPGSSSSTRLYNEDTHSTFCRCGDGDRVKQILVQWNSVLLILDDNTVTRLTETDMNEKIQQLVKNEQFDVARTIAQSRRMPAKVTSEIDRQHGDSYCDKGQFREAIEKYVATIGFLEPSYVITRFIDPQKAEHLVTYLEALDSKGMSTPQHTTLRFNCYTKLSKGVRRIEGGRESPTSGHDKLMRLCEECVEDGRAGRPPKFDIRTAVQVLVRADYKEQALRIANAHRLHTEYTQMLAAAGDYAQILDYLRGVETSIATKILQTYGNDMMAAFGESERTTFRDFLISACTEGLHARPGSDERLPLNPDHIMRVFLNFPQAHYGLLAAYIDFLSDRDQLDRVSQDVWNTVIELACALGDEEKVHKYFALAAGRFDSEQLLLLFSAEKCHYGLILIYEHLGYFQEILKISNGEEIIQVCLKHGSKDRDLWRRGLVKLASAKDYKNLRALVEEIADKDALPLLAVIQILRVYNAVTFGMIKPLALKVFQSEQAEIDQLSLAYGEIEADVCKKEDLCEDLTHKHFIAKATKCNACDKGIDLPAKHFFCGHSFHMRCLGDDLKKCPTCKERQEETVKKKVESYKHARGLLKVDPTSKYRFKFLEHMDVQDFGDEGHGADPFTRMTEALAGDLLNPDEDKAKQHEAKDLLAEYSQSYMDPKARNT
jgi:hypothetical protein